MYNSCLMVKQIEADADLKKGKILHGPDDILVNECKMNVFRKSSQIKLKYNLKEYDKTCWLVFQYKHHQ